MQVRERLRYWLSRGVRFIYIDEVLDTMMNNELKRIRSDHFSIEPSQFSLEQKPATREQATQQQLRQQPLLMAQIEQMQQTRDQLFQTKDIETKLKMIKNVSFLH